MPAPRLSLRRAFTLIELLVVVAVIALLIALLLPALKQARQAGRAAVCMSNLRQLGVGAANYSIDFKGAIFSFTWSVGNQPSDYADLRVPANSAADACAKQATDIIRKHSAVEPNFAEPTPWIPNVEYTHLVLLDFLASRLPEPMVACPEDRNLLLWQSNIPLFNAGGFGVNGPPFNGPEAAVFRAKPYSSSYEVSPASYDSSPAGHHVMQSTMGQYWYQLDGLTKFGGNKLESVTFPALKAHMYDTIQRHRGRQLYFAHEDSSQPVLQFDSSVVMRRTRDSGQGWQPNNPAQGPTIINYRPYQFEPPTSTGAPVEALKGHYRWTRGGLGGVDYGAEVNMRR
jgi:prepilin-type N-terminal cleavage/methylation domain-containing protein